MTKKPSGSIIFYLDIEVGVEHIENIQQFQKRTLFQ